MALMIVSTIKRALLTVILTPLVFAAHGSNKEPTTHAMSLYDLPKYGLDFTHFDYVNPDAPKGGTVKMPATGTFDNLNPYIEKGTSAYGLSLIYDTLMVPSKDEAFSVYPLIAQSYELDREKSSITFHLNPDARFHDGKKITAEDIDFTFSTLMEKGSPFYQAYYGGVKNVEVLSPQTIRFNFKNTGNRELPLILTQLPVFPKHFWEKPENDFATANLNLPLGSGPYQIDTVDAGKQITYKRVKDYWAANLPVNKGRYNFDTRQYHYYRDQNISIEAFKARAYDIRFENVAKNWATAYDIDAVTSGELIKESIPTRSPAGMQGYTFNLRNPLFQDINVRKAISYAMDFEWLNRNLFYGSYHRTSSYFANSEMASTGLPSKEELELLEPFRHQLPSELFTKPYELPVTDGSGNIRSQLGKALALLNDAGWKMTNGKLLDSNNKPFEFELLIESPAIERVALPFKKNLELMGITMTIRHVDISQYINRLRKFDFDMLVSVFPQSNSPGNEQKEFWGSDTADIPGTRNIIGIKSPVIDALINHIIKAPSRQALVTATRALDRVLLRGEYSIPQWHLPGIRVAYWQTLQHPATEPLYSMDFESWWYQQPTLKTTDITETTSASEQPSGQTMTIITVLISLLIIIGLIASRRQKKIP